MFKTVKKAKEKFTAKGISLTQTPIQKAGMSSAMATITTIALLPLGLIINPIAIEHIGIEQFGLYSLIIGIASSLVVIEGGLNHAITQASFEPIVNENWSEVRTLNLILRKYYKYIGCLILVLGIAFSPFLPFVVNNPDFVQTAYILYVIAILEIVGNFIFFVGKRPILDADQRQYIGQFYYFFTSIMTIILKIFAAIVFNSIIMYALVEIGFRVINLVLLKRKANKIYGFIDDFPRVEILPKKVNKIKKNMIGAFIIILSGVTLNLDNVLISMYIGLSTVGIFVNYSLVALMIGSLIPSVTASLTAGIGQAVVKWSPDQSAFELKVLRLANFLPALFSTSGYLVCIQFFIPMWIGPDYLLPDHIVIFMAFSMILPAINGGMLDGFIYAYGLTWDVKHSYIFGALIRLSLLFLFVTVFHLELIGIILAGIIADFIQTGVFKFLVLKGKVYKQTSTGIYKQMAFFFIQTLFLFSLSVFCTSQIHLGNNLLQFIVNGCISSGLFIVSLFLFNFKTKEFRHLWNIIGRAVKFLPNLSE